MASIRNNKHKSNMSYLYFDKPFNNDLSETSPTSFINIFSLKSIKCVIISVFLFFLITLVVALAFTIYFIMDGLYDKITDKYLNNYIIEPIRVSNENYTAIITTRKKVIGDIMIENHLSNLQSSIDLNFNYPELSEYLKVNSKNNPSSQNSYTEDLFLASKLEITNNNEVNDYDGELYTTEFSSFESLMEKFRFSLIYLKKMFRDNIYPQEIVLYDRTYNFSMSYYHEANNYNRMFLKNKIIDFQDVFEYQFTNNTYINYIVKNKFDRNNYYNYLVLKNYTKNTYNNYNFHLGYDFAITNFTQILNIQNINASLIFRENLVSKPESKSNKDLETAVYGNIDYKAIHNQNLFQYFFSFAILNQQRIIEITKNGYYFPLLEIAYFNSNLTNYFESLVSNDYNTNFESEFNIFTNIFYRVSDLYFNTTFKLQDYYSNECQYDNNTSNIICSIIRNYDELNVNHYIQKLKDNGDQNLFDYIENYISKDSNYTYETYPLTEFQKYIYLLNDSSMSFHLGTLEYLSYPTFTDGLYLPTNFRFKYPYYTEKRLFKEGVNSDSSLSHLEYKKLMIYKDEINNLSFSILQMNNLIQYSQILNNFQSAMNDYGWVIFVIGLFLCIILVFAFSFVIVNAVVMMIKRIEMFNDLRKDIFLNPESLYKPDLKLKHEEITKYVLNIYQGNVKEVDKIKLFEKDKYNYQYLVLVIELKNNLEAFIENIEDLGDDVHVNSHMFKRKYRLLASYDYIMENDYEEAFLVYSQISYNDFFNLNQLCYNNYFSLDFVNRNLRVLYKILNFVEENNILTEKKNKSLEIEEIIKICYDFKKTVLDNLMNVNNRRRGSKRIMNVLDLARHFQENLNK